MELVVFINIGVLILLSWFIFSMQKNKGASVQGDAQEMTNQILLHLHTTLSENKQETIEKLLDRLSQNQMMQTEQSARNLQKTEERFGEIQVKIQESLLEGLGKNQLMIQERLEKALLNLSENNKMEIAKLQETTRVGLEFLTKTNQEKLDRINLEVQKRLDDNFEKHTKSFEEVGKSLAGLKETAGRMIDSTKSVEKLNTIFERTSSKAFGNFGEKYLESLLSEHLHKDTWQKQVKIPGSNDQIDFVINLDNKRIGIDSKFPVTKYQDFIDAPNEEKPAKLKDFLKTVLLMATEISQKYYKENYLDTLFLYLPSDSMYNEVVNNPQVVETLHKVKVTATSPSTVFPLIMLVQTYQFRLKVNQNAETIIKGLTGVSKNIQGFKEEFRKLGEKIRLAQENYDKADRNLVGVERNILMLEQKEKVEELLFEEN